jgi:hypothetical protein
MAGYLDEYGAADVRREKFNRWLIISGAVVFAAFVVWWFLFSWDKSEVLREPHLARLVQKLRNHRQEAEIGRFLDLVKNHQYDAAYRVWGPNKDYPFADFLKDWGPQSQRSDLSSFNIARSRTCGSGVIVTVELPRGAEESLWVQKADQTIGFSPFRSGCPASP